jgi:hypothetical protein
VLRARSPVALRGSAGDVYSSMVSDQLVAKTNQPTKGLTRDRLLREAQSTSPRLFSHSCM